LSPSSKPAHGITNFEDAEQFERHQEMRRFNQRQDEKQGKRAAKLSKVRV
jgi:hypothetical protein